MNFRRIAPAYRWISMSDKTLKIVLVCAGLWMTACASDTENKAINEIRERYNCQIAYSKTFAATSSGSGRSFDVTLAASPYMDSLIAEEPASFSAFTIYNNLTPEERQKYSSVRVAVVQTQANAKKTSSYEFDLPKLALIVSKYHHVEQAIGDLKKRRYDTMFNQLNPAVGATVDKPKVTRFLDSLLTSHGDIHGYRFRGFYFFDETLGSQTLHLIALKGVLMRNRDDHNFNIFVSQDPRDEQVYGVTFK